MRQVGNAPRGAARSNDTIQIAAGAKREVTFVAGAPGTYYYYGVSSARVR